MEKLPYFSIIFSGEDNFCDFLIASHDEALHKWGLLLKERIYSKGSKFSALKLITTEKGGKNGGMKKRTELLPL